MRKANLLLLGIVFIVLVLPIISATIENSIMNVTGNDSALTFTLSTIQISVNPLIGANITYTTIVNVTSVDDTWNITEFLFYLPDDSTTEVAIDYVFRNESDQKNASSFNAADYNYLNFTELSNYLIDYANGTTFNITWALKPIESTKLSVSQLGRAYTETWNITSLATNLTIENASLIVIPSYWYNRIGTPTSVLFNNTAKEYSANLTEIAVFTDLNLSSNLEETSSGWGTLSITFNGPEVDPSSGKSSTKVAPTPLIPEEKTFRVILFVLIGLIFVGAIITLVIVLAKKK